MKRLAYYLLLIVFISCAAMAAYILFLPKGRETWATLAALLAVIAAVIAAFPALRVMEIQEDLLRPRPIPYFDLASRQNLLQLRVKNFGGGVAYAVELIWENQPTDYKGSSVSSLDKISSLLPQESASTLVGSSSDIVRKLADARFEGVCKFKDSTGKSYRERFVCSVDGNQKQLVHDNELPKTLRELQDVPKELQRIADLLEKFTRTE